MKYTLFAVLFSLPGFSATVFDCRYYDCGAGFARSRVPAADPAVPLTAITNSLGHAVWLSGPGGKLNFYNGAQIFTSSQDVAPDFHLFDLSDNDVIGWYESPGSFWLKGTANLDAFSTRVFWDPSVAGGLYYYFGFAIPLRLSANGDGILLEGVGTRLWQSGGPVGPLIDQNLVAALNGPSNLRAIPEPALVPLLGLALLVLAARRLQATG